MSHEILQMIWFILIAVLWIGFFVLEGFDFGVGLLLPFLGKKDEDRRAIGSQRSGRCRTGRRDHTRLRAACWVAA